MDHELILLKYSYYPNDLKAISIKIPLMFSTEIGKKILKFVCNNKLSQIVKAVLRKNKVDASHFLISKL